MESCDECRFVYASVAAAEVPDRLRSFGPRYAERLTAADETAARRRPAPDVWSAVEYGAHVRDVLLVQRERLHLALITDEPAFPPMHRDERAVNAAYATTPIDDLVIEVDVAAKLLARDAATLDTDALDRTGTYFYPAPARRSLLWLLRHTIHEGEHHLIDLERSLAG